ncbi:chlorite dismutase [Natronoarchaeum philippinense]|uniref:Chlorite dismutase n=1 Tax=Natronoarchaeum philippinense TaxID=558529 RepID=A0A285P3L6_NATPI|nr:heme-binding protein [Natronoarchaeum philippinense]SNZ16329.1 chlorite dismutase [Natronoarchaeum philippinense]
MERREPPQTDEGWYVLHDLRTIDWDAWRGASERDRELAIDDGVEFLEAAENLDDADAGASAVFSVFGHEADLLILHLRPTIRELDTLERRFEQTAFAEFTERTNSYLSVTEASGYTGAEAYFDPEQEADPGITNYIESRLYPDLPDAEFVSFYPMDKRRQPEQNWYDLSFEDRADLMSGHGDIGRDYAGKVSQIISGSVGLDDFEWGVTLFADDPTDVKDLLYEMRFDPSSSKYAEFGSFVSGRRFPPADLDALLAGEPVPTEERTDDAAGADEELLDELDRFGVDAADAPAGSSGLVVYSEADVETVREEVDGLRGNFEHYDSHLLTEVYEDGDDAAIVSLWETDSAAGTAAGFLEELPGVSDYHQGSLGGDADGEDADDGRDAAANDDSGESAPSHAHGSDEDTDIREELEDRGIYAGQPHGEDVYALVLYSEADPEELSEEVESLSDGFDRYDTHLGTSVYEAPPEDADPAVVSLWETESAAGTASDYLDDLPGIVRQAGDRESGFGTMGMFYTVKPDHRDDFVEKFDTVGGLLADMDGHVRTDLYANREDENDMFIASRWESREDCMAFFRSDAFSDTVDWGRDVLADRPRHVFLA